MKIIKYLLVFLVSVCAVNFLNAQKLQPVRLEVPSDINAASFNVKVLGEKGVLIFYESNEMTKDNQRKWFFGLFDTSLKQEWLKFIPLADKLEYVESKQSDNKLRLLFRNITRGRSEEGSYEIVTYDLRSSTFTKVTGTFPTKAEIAGFETIGNTGCIAINIRQQKTDLVFVDLTSGDVNPVHIMQDSESYILKLQADSKNRKFYVALKMIKDNRYMSDGIIRFSMDGIQETVYDIQIIESLKSLSKYVFIPVANDQLKIFGTYDIITKRVSSFKDVIDSEEAKSAGMFYLQFDNNEQTALKFYDFLNFDNIYGSLGNRKMEYKKVPGDEGNENTKQLTAYYHLVDPKVMKINRKYIFSVEVYKPIYTTETRMDYDYYGRPVPYSYQVFGGYDFYDVIVVGLTEDGELIWNNDFAINGLQTSSIERNSVVFNDDEFITIAYVNNGKIHLQTIEGPVDIGKAETTIVSKIEKDRVAEDEFNRIEHWYDKYFLVYGYQKLKNRTLDEQSTRTAFYVNKIAYN